MKLRLRAAAWVAFLGPFFFLTYNFANYAASRRDSVPVLMFPWETHIPFLAWTILPYWSSDLLYAISLAICTTRQELDLQGKRLIAIQVFSIACFLAFPLRLVFERPALTGWSGEMFNTLTSFDRPFNEAPSLHVSLAVILWTRYRAHTSSLLAGAWFSLVALSSLTTYQHHFIDVPTGLWAGLLVVAALPEHRQREPYYKLTALYLSGALVCTIPAFALGWWPLLWPGFALSMVAAAYWTTDAKWLRPYPWMWPYTLAAFINSRLWTRGQAPRNLLKDGVWIGRAPINDPQMKSVVTLAPELPMRGDAHISMLDLMLPTVEQLVSAVNAIKEAPRPTLVCCALGYSRSALTAAAWLLSAGHATTPDDAIRQVRQARPQVILKPEAIALLVAVAPALRPAAGPPAATVNPHANV